MSSRRPRWTNDPAGGDVTAISREEYQLLIADYAQRVAGEWASALRRGDATEAAVCVARLRALAAAGVNPGVEAPALDADLRAIDEASTGRGARLFTGSAPSLWDGLHHLGEAVRQIDIVVAYAQPRGVRLLEPWLRAVGAHPGPPRVRVLVGTYLNGTAVEALHDLLRLSRSAPGVTVRLLADPTVHFHPKIYRVVDASGRTHLFVGSSNLSYSALTGHAAAAPAVEWNLALDDAAAPGVVQAASARLDDFFATCGDPLTEAAIAAYEAQRSYALPPAALFEGEDDGPAPASQPDPKPAQVEALAALKQVRDQGYQRALVVAATGVGKTVLAALDSLEAAREGRVLFLAHREALLEQARGAFERVRPGETCGLVCVGARELGARHQFVSIASAHHVDPSTFHYVVVDEAHHAAAKSYQDVFDRLPGEAFVLGLTATPDRLDGGDIYELFDNVVAYEASLFKAIGEKWLVPFHYFGLRDTVDYNTLRWVRGYDPDDLERSVLDAERMARVVSALLDPRYPGARTLAFCVSIRHAVEVAQQLTLAGLPAAAVHSGPSSLDPHAAIARLRRGALRALCVVDMFNEGIDIPEVDRVAFLRPTDSPVVFLQQLGRGLRCAPGKSALVVVDFVGNHRRSELKPEWLGVDATDLAEQPPGQAYARSFDDGREVYFEPAAVDAIRTLGQRRIGIRAQIQDAFDRLREDTPDAPRPSYRLFLAHSGFPHVTIRNQFGSWSKLLEDRGARTPQDEVLSRAAGATELLEAVETTGMSGPHKMLLLGALANARKARCSVTEAAKLFKAFIEQRHPAVLASPKIAKRDLETVPRTRALLLKTAALFLSKSAPACFRLDRRADTFEIVVPEGVDDDLVLDAIGELAEARLYEFLRRRPTDGA